MVDLASRIMTGASLKEFDYGTGLYRTPPYFAVKVPVFSFEKLTDVNSYLGPEMKSTGEVMGTDQTFAKALYKAFAGAKMQLPDNGSVLLTIEDNDKQTILPLAKRFALIGWRLLATKGTADFLKENGLHVETVGKIGEDDGDHNILRGIKDNKVDLVINTMGHDYAKNSDGFIIRQTAIEHNIPLLTALDTVDALLMALENRSFTTAAL